VISFLGALNSFSQHSPKIATNNYYKFLDRRPGCEVDTSPHTQVVATSFVRKEVDGSLAQRHKCGVFP